MFATSSPAAARWNAAYDRTTVLRTGTGREAIAPIESTPGLAIVLTDIMMLEMNGYETMRSIRRSASPRRLPVVACTPGAMKEDREKCLEAGALQYLAKPHNTGQLLSALHMWLHLCKERSISPRARRGR